MLPSVHDKAPLYNIAAGLRKKDLRYNVEQIVICPRCQALLYEAPWGV